MKNERNPIDDLFRKGLGDLEMNPPPERRDIFLKEAGAITKRRNGKKYLFLLAGLFTVILGGSIVSYMTFYDEDRSDSVAKYEAVQPALYTEVTSAIAIDQAVTSHNTKEHKSEPSQNISSNYIDTSTFIKNHANDPSSEKAISAFISHPESFSNNILPPATTNITDTTTSPPSPPSPSSPSSPSSPPSPPSPPSPSSPPSPKPHDWSISAGIHYTPEWMFNTLDDGKFVNNFGIEGSLAFGRYSVRTGVGLSIAKGITEVAVGYNDYLGSYEQLDSITFAWDEKHYHLLPTYYLTDADVWDSLMKLDYPKIEKRYIYLQIPLVLGYDFVQKNRFSMGVRVGPILSILLSSKELTAEYDPGKNRIVQINQVTPDRIQTNWQVMGGISASYRLSDHISIELEPEVRYYFNSVYEKGGLTQKPWSVGVRTALNFKF